MEFTDGTTQLVEVEAGSGYYAQSTTDRFFGWRNQAAPRSILVRWPNGSETTERFVSEPTAATVTITAP